MVRVGRALVILHVARNTIRAAQVVVSIAVALRALQGRVCSGERKSHQRVIERSRRPGGRGVAGLAGLREVSGHVVRIGGLLIIGQMATRASCRSPFKPSADMASRAVERGVRPGQGEAGGRQMVKLRPKPTIHTVAILTGGGEAAGYVTGLGRPIILGVARITLRSQSLELAGGRAGMAGRTVKRGMRSRQREAVLVLIDLLHGNLPSLDGVALFARRAKLALMNIRVAVGAFLADLGEYRFGMALGASHLLVHSAKWESGLIVVEFGDCPDRLPTVHGVTVLAGNAEWAMRASGACGGRPLAGRRQREHKPNKHM